MLPRPPSSIFFFFNDTATTEIYTLSLHDALPIFFIVFLSHHHTAPCHDELPCIHTKYSIAGPSPSSSPPRSEEPTSELQSPQHLVFPLLPLYKPPTTPPSRHPTTSFFLLTLPNTC